jgi:hypothetical protein
MAVLSLKYKTKQGTLTAPAEIDLGAMIPIATVTIGSGGTTPVTFTSIPTYYTHLQLRCLVRSAGTSADRDSFQFIFNGDTSTNYSDHRITGDGSSVAASVRTNSTTILLPEISSNGYTSNIFTSVIVDILDYTDTNKYKTVRSLGGFDSNGIGIEKGAIRLGSGAWRSTSAITSITITTGGGRNMVQYSTFSLYGIKGAGA